MILLLKPVTVLFLTSFIIVAESQPIITMTLTDWTVPCPVTVADAVRTLRHVRDNIPHELPQEDVENQLNKIMNLTTCVIRDDLDSNDLTTFGLEVLNTVEYVMSMLITDSLQNSSTIKISVDNLEVDVFTLGRSVNGTDVQLNTKDASVAIDLHGLATINDASTAVAFMSYTNMTDILKQSFLNTITRATETSVISNVVSAMFLQTNTYLANPVVFILKHVMPLNPQDIISCMNWKANTWDTCSLIRTNTTHTMCSCESMTALAVISQTDPCRFYLTEECAVDFLNQLQNNIPQDLTEESIEKYLTILMDLTTEVTTTFFSYSYGNILMNVIEKLVTALVQKNKILNISLQTFELQVITIEPQDFLTKFSLNTSHASMDINLTAAANINKGRASVAFMSYINMANILEPTFFKTFTDTQKTIVSTLVSATIPSATSTNLTKPVNFTLKHIQFVAPDDILSCMYWERNRWVAKHCTITETNSSHSVCSCNHLGTFALIMQNDPCRDYLIRPCTVGFLYQIPLEINQGLPQEMVKNYLTIIMNLTSRLAYNISDINYLTSYGNAVLNITEQLVSTLGSKGNPPINNMLFQDFEVNIVVTPNISSSKILQLQTQYASLDINLPEISTNNNGSAAVALMSYTSLVKILKPSFFKTITSTNKTMMSTVVSASLPKTTNAALSTPVKITFKHIYELAPKDILSCVYWKTDEWLNDGCRIIQFNKTHTECSCDHVATFALILQTDPCSSDRLINMLIAVSIIVGLVFLSVSIVTLSLYSRNPVTNTALINLCINLLLFHFLRLIKTLFLDHIQHLQLRAVLAGTQWFFLLSVFVWMFIEAVLLYNFMKNISEIRSYQDEVFSWKWLIVIGYLIPLGVLGMSGVNFPKGYIDEECWCLEDGRMIFIFAGPVLFTVTLNLILCFTTVIIMIFTLKKLKNEILHTSSSAENNLIICLMLRSLTQFILLVCFWILLYIPSKNGALYHAFRFLNSQQGTFIFLIHCLFNQEVRQKYRNVMSALCFSNSPLATSRSVRGQTEESRDN